MTLLSQKLRHRVVIQQFQDVLDEDGNTQQDENGTIMKDWIAIATVWAGIEPLSAREFIAAQAEQSKVSARITIRYRPDVDFTMRLYHPGKDKYYNIEGVLADKESGLEYLTLPVSEGVRYA